MKWNDWKYLLAYVAPLSAYWGISEGGHWTFAAIYVAFIIIPILDVLTPQSTANLTPPEEANKLASRFFDVLLYLNVPLLYGLVFYYFATLQAGGLSVLEITGMTFSVGLVVGSIGINVAHELGHRDQVWEQHLSKVLLLSALYMHFFIEHNRGHHKNVATDEDPATSRYNEPVYFFWLRSVTGGYRNAWRLERERLQRLGKSAWSWQNEMLRFQGIQLVYLGLIGWWFGLSMIPFALAIAMVGILLLESVNYIEHYGLRRRRLESGRYEPVQPIHSWNSDHEVGRIFLYELTRHSDHHYKANRKYQVLRHFEESPQLPLGYPASILAALVPPLWFGIMNRRVQAWQVGMAKTS